MRFPKDSLRARANRRYLFSKHSFGRSKNRLGQFLDGSVEPRLLCTARSAMACDFQIRIPDSTRSHIPKVQQAFDLIDDLEAQLSVYRPSSEISRINSVANCRPFSVEPQLLQLLDQAKKLSIETGGAFDITGAPYGKAWGIFDRQGRVPDNDEIAAIKSIIGSRLLEIDLEIGTLRFRRSGVEINLGGIGKGYALDQASILLQDNGVRNALLHAGFSTIIAVGDAPSSPSMGWSVGIRHPLKPGQDFAILRLVDSALATSGSGEQGFVIDGERVGHIIDPRTGYPARGRLLSSAVAPTGALADALSTAFFVMDTHEIRAYCDSHQGVGALMVRRKQGEEANLLIETIGSLQNAVQLVQ